MQLFIPKKMIESYISQDLFPLGFSYNEDNEYTINGRYVRKLRNLSSKGIDYHTCAILIEDWSDNYFIFKICGRRTVDDVLVDLTRNIFPGVGQLLYRDRIVRTISHLEYYRKSASLKYGV